MPIGPLPLERVVDGFRFAEVVPQPRYPDPSVSLISDGSSPLLLAPPTTGKVGSLFGLKPYSSTSFLLNSSASFLCFRFRQRKRAAVTIKATATTGTTTATAILPPAERPEPVEALDPDDASAALVFEEAADLEVVLCTFDMDGEVETEEVEVTKTVDPWFVDCTPSLLVVGGAVKTDVEMIVNDGGTVV